jgi:hypothetical protein
MLAGFTGYDLTLPHTGAVVHCQVPTLATSAKLIRLFEASKASDASVADLMEAFPVDIGVEPRVFDGLTPAEFVAVVAGFFSVRRDLESPSPVPSPASPPFSTEPT